MIGQLPPDQRVCLAIDQVQERGLIVLDLDGTIVDWTFGTQCLLQWSAAEIIGRPVSVIFTSEDNAAGVPLDEMQTARLQGRSPDVRWHVRKDGTRVFIDGALTALHAPDGNLIGYAKTLSEASAAQELRRSEAKLRAMVNATPHMVWAANARGDGDYFNERMEAFTGVPSAQLQGDGWFALVQPDDRSMVRTTWTHSLTTGQSLSMEFRFRHVSGDFRWVLCRGEPVRDDADGSVRWMGTNIDIHVQKVAQQSLAQREERYRALFNAIAEGFCIIDLIYDEQDAVRDYRFLETNPSLERLTGLSYLDGKTLREVLPAPHMPWLQRYAEVVRTGQPMRFTDYSPNIGRWFDISAIRLGGEGSRQIALLSDDITERRQNEEELRRLAAGLSQANRRQSEFLATLAHELRNPLAPLRTGLDVIQSSLEVSPQVARIHEMMNRQVDHMVHLIDDLLDLARINSGKIVLKKSRQRLQDIVRHAIEVSRPVIDNKHHVFTAKQPDEGIWVEADATRLSQVISNLVTNAAKYTPESGKVELTVARERNEAVITVTDSGIGIASNDLPHLFDMFSQVGRGMEHAQGGLGIGLHLVKRLTEKHGGTVQASSAGPGCGSSFTVRLPVSEHGAGMVDEENGATSAPKVPLSLRILVADDNRDAAEMLKDLLQVQGHTVRLATDGSQALEMIRIEKPDLALLDIGMPLLNGYEIAKAIRQDASLSGVTLAAVTGWGASDDRLKSKAAGFDYHLTKPLGLDALLALIAKVNPIGR